MNYLRVGLAQTSSSPYARGAVQPDLVLFWLVLGFLALHTLLGASRNAFFSCTSQNAPVSLNDHTESFAHILLHSSQVHSHSSCAVCSSLGHEEMALGVRSLRQSDIWMRKETASVLV